MKNILRQAVTTEKRILIPLVLLSFVLVLIFGVSGVSAADGDVIYVNESSGNDSWDGLSATYTSGTNGPKRSVKNATGTVNTNGTIYIADGNYRGVNNTKITISKNMNIIGQSQTGTIINGTDTNWIFKILSGFTVTIQNITLTNGNTINNGGAIYNNGNLTVNNSIFMDNTADAIDYLEVPVNGFGGAIYNNGALNIDNSNFTGNRATYGGGAIHNNGDLTVTGSNFADNHVFQGGYGGGAISNRGTLTVNGSDFTNNDAYACGGAIYNDKDLNVDESTFSGNQAYAAGGAIYNIGTLTATGSSFANNAAYGCYYSIYPKIAGGAIYNDYGGIYTVDSCQFEGNTPQDIYNNTEPITEPQSSLYLKVIPGKIKPIVGNTVVYTIKVGNKGPDTAECVYMVYIIPKGLEFVGAKVDVGEWMYYKPMRAVFWMIENVPVGDPYMQLSLRIVKAGQYTINPMLMTSTYDPTLESNTGSLTFNAVTRVNAASNTIPLRKTGLPLAGLVMAILMVLGGFAGAKRK